MTQEKIPPDSQKTEEKTNGSRRKFLQNVGLAGLSAGAVSLAGQGVLDDVSAETPVKAGVTPDESRA
ncbi:MAG: twin-arginine translocation signal domain-containing protein, partial [Microcystaceae cyanobacterium]